MSKLITVRNSIIERMIKEKSDNKSYSDVIAELFGTVDMHRNMKEVIVTNEGRISKSLAGKTIKYLVVE